MAEEPKKPLRRFSVDHIIKGLVLPKGYEENRATFEQARREGLKLRAMLSNRYSRQTVISAARVLKSLGHTGFKGLLLEFGLEDTSVGQGSSLMERSNSLAHYALRDPEHVTAEGERVDAAIVRLAARQARDCEGLSNVRPDELHDFRHRLASDGFGITATGHVFPVKADDPSVISGGEALDDTRTGAGSEFSGSSFNTAEKIKMPREFDSKVPLPRRVFIVHGHDDAARLEVTRFLERLEFNVVVLHEQVNKGRTIIEKFEANSDVGFVVVLLTPDDPGGLPLGPGPRRARQNVILEWGYFIGKLGRAYVCALKKGDIELPSDTFGVVWEPLDEYGAWKMKLAKELAAVKFDIDWQKVAQ